MRVGPPVCGKVHVIKQRTAATRLVQILIVITHDKETFTFLLSSFTILYETKFKVVVLSNEQEEGRKRNNMYIITDKW